MKLSGLLCSLSVLALIGLGGPKASAADADAVAVIVGNGQYSHPDIPSVDFAHRDAQAMHRFVRDVLGFREENILLLTDASQAQMESTFGRQGNPRGKAYQYIRPDKSDLFVFYSGHGLPSQDQQRRYLLPTDADLATVDINGYPLDVLYDNLSQLGARSVTVMVDACFSGGSHRGPLIKGASGVKIIPKDEPNPTSSLTVLTAASADQLASWDEEAEHGLFTEYLLRALYGAADQKGHGNGDGQITLQEVKAYLDDEMRYKARRAYNREQVPTVIGAPDLVLVAAVDGTFAKRPDLPRSPQSLIGEPVLDPMDLEMESVTTSNVRAGPDLRSLRVGMLPKGTKVKVTGKVVDRPWFLVERQGDRMGYVYASLLREPVPEPILVEPPVVEPPAPTVETPDEAVEALEDRLKQLEAEMEYRSREGSMPEDPPPLPRYGDEMDFERLPPPPSRPGFNPPRRPPPGGQVAHRPPPRRPNGDKIRPLMRLRETLDEMAQILVRQNYIERVEVPVDCPGPDDGKCIAEGSSALFYGQITPLPRSCTLKVQATFEHDRLIRADGSRKGTYVRDRKVSLNLFNKNKVRDKTLTIKSQTEGQLLAVEHYLFGKARFIDKDDRDRFARLAREANRLCRTIPLIANRQNR
ncbi:caspase family protein [Magnetospira sp. QH-2]|uniref:caspase family protein n=1 Tax=Magnetospira sp. (strain QH-2) TaxID=1288970 RepID=UPI0003E8148A|nr:caspase family protein [Magnetospira sp. QH-2]CCQ75272.1 exported protein of unknown function [Magnetospira sp. QH-2]